MTPLKEITRSRKFDALHVALSPILAYLDDPAILDIMVNADGRVWIDEIARGLSCTQTLMKPEEVERIIRLLAASINAEIND